jgi:hypothetical protein
VVESGITLPEPDLLLYYIKEKKEHLPYLSLSKYQGWWLSEAKPPALAFP